MAQKARAKNSRGKAKPAPTKRRRKRAKPEGPWGALTLAVLLAVLVARLAVNAMELFPVHFDEAQYWAYGNELDWGYFSKPPLVAWLIRAVTQVAGDTLFSLRLASPVAHALIAWLTFLTGRRLWDGQTGFWAATGYTAAPGVGLSAMIMPTDPVLMMYCAAALYAMVRAAKTKTGAKTDDDLELAELGLTIGTLSAEIRAQLGISGDITGVVVTGVANDGTAAEKGVRPGDIIIEVGQEPVGTPAEVEARVADAVAAGRKSVLFLIQSGGDLRFVPLAIGG